MKKKTTLRFAGVLMVTSGRSKRLSEMSVPSAGLLNAFQVEITGLS